MANEANPLVIAYVDTHKDEIKALNTAWIDFRKKVDETSGSMQIDISRVMLGFWMSLTAANKAATTLRDFRRYLLTDVETRAQKVGCTVGTYGVYCSQAVTVITQADMMKETIPALGLMVDENGNVVPREEGFPAGVWKTLIEKYAKSSSKKKDVETPAQIAEKYVKSLPQDERLKFLGRVLGDDLEEFVNALAEFVEEMHEQEEAAAAAQK